MRSSKYEKHFHIALLERRPPLSVAVAALVVAAMAMSLPARADFITVWGGPAFNATTQTGFESPTLPVNPGATAGNGMAVGGGFKITGGQGSGTRAVRWDAAGGAAVELGNLGTNSTGATNSEAIAVNAAGTSVGHATKYVGGTFLDRRAVRWNAGGTVVTELGNLGTSSGGVSNSTAFAINPAGTAAGVAYKYNGVGNLLGVRAVRWDASGTAATELGNLGTDAFGNTFGRAWAINDGGTAVGSQDRYVGGIGLGERAVRWDGAGTAATELNSLGADSSNSSHSEALAVNGAGTAVGYSFKYTGNPFQGDVGTRAVRWDASGIAATELGHLGTNDDGITNSKAYDINSAGTAIGSAVKYTGGSYQGNHAVRWDAGSTVATELGHLGLPSAGFIDITANAINDAGITVGNMPKYVGDTSLGHRAVLWNLDAVAFDLNDLIDPGSGWTLTSARGISETLWVSGIGHFDPDGAAGPLAAYSRAFLLDVSTAVPEPGTGLLFSIAIAFVAAHFVARRRTNGSR